jgi:hypothetical protein
VVHLFAADEEATEVVSVAVMEEAAVSLAQQPATNAADPTTMLVTAKLRQSSVMPVENSVISHAIAMLQTAVR